MAAFGISVSFVLSKHFRIDEGIQILNLDLD